MSSYVAPSPSSAPARPRARHRANTAAILQYMLLAEQHYKEGRMDLARVAMALATHLLSDGALGRQDGTDPPPDTNQTPSLNEGSQDV